ncbi:beta-galactoside-binding lectin-like [Neosynchiropus ocellatus]
MSELVIKNMPFRVGQTLTVKGFADYKADRFAMNIIQDGGNVALHINPRFNAAGDENKVVCSAKVGDDWGPKIYGTTFPFKRGEKFTMAIAFHPNEFLLRFTDGSTITFPNRIGDQEYSFFTFNDDVLITHLEIIER